MTKSELSRAVVEGKAIIVDAQELCHLMIVLNGLPDFWKQYVTETKDALLDCARLYES